MFFAKKNIADKFKHQMNIPNFYSFSVKFIVSKGKKLIIFFTLGFLTFAESAKAAIKFDPLSSYGSIQEVIGGVTNWVLGIAAGITILFLIVGGIYYITAAGDDKQMEEGKKIINYAIIGLIVILISYSLVITLNAIIFG